MWLLFGVLVLLAKSSEQHYIYVPVVANGHFLPQESSWVVHHFANPSVVEHGAGGSRETLEENSGEDSQQEEENVSVEQTHQEPDDVQVTQEVEHAGRKNARPAVPTLPARPSARPSTRPSVRPVDEEANVIHNGPQPDGSYDFSYNLHDQSRNEKADADGNVVGSYSYIGPDGKKISITYTAGPNKGFVPVGEGILPPHGNAVGTGGEYPEKGYDDEQQSHIPVPDDEQVHQPLPDDSQTQEEIPTDNQEHDSGEEGPHKGMPYSYNYRTDLHSKTETADDNGNVKGEYTYIDGAGVMRTVTYTVNGDEGFVAHGDIHPDGGNSNSEPSQPPNGVKGYKPKPPTGNEGWQPKPPTGNEGWQPKPPTGNEGWQPKPPTGNEGWQPKPPTGNEGWQPKPPIGNEGWQPKPPTGNEGWQPKPPTDTKGGAPKPPTEAKGGYPQPPIIYGKGNATPPVEAKGSKGKGGTNQEKKPWELGKGPNWDKYPLAG